MGVATPVCGPGSMAQGHKADEYISIAQTERCMTMLRQLCAWMRAEPAEPPHLIPQHRNPSDAQSTLSPHRSSDHRPLAGGWRGVIERRLYPWVERLAEGVTALMASPSEYGHARTVIPQRWFAAFFRTTATGRGSRRLASLSFSQRPPRSRRR
ncbi:hypothetical protein LNQ03_00290 [Klebsiella pneumoniae subsp. pneumoniae]|nr:hypothetical protein [Klebsiella pneumoniae subsp. pneumoniae]